MLIGVACGDVSERRVFKREREIPDKDRVRHEPVSALAQELLDGYFAGPERGEAAARRIDQMWRAGRSAGWLSAGAEERLEALAAAAEGMAGAGSRFPEAEIRLVAHLAKGQSESSSRRLAIS